MEELRSLRDAYCLLALKLLREPARKSMSHEEAMASEWALELHRYTGLPLDAAAWLVRITDATRSTHPGMIELDPSTQKRGFVGAWATTAPSGSISASEKRFNRWRGGCRGWDSFFCRTLEGLTTCAGEPFDLRSLYDIAALKALGDDHSLRADFSRYYGCEFAKNQPPEKRRGPSYD